MSTLKDLHMRAPAFLSFCKFPFIQLLITGLIVLAPVFASGPRLVKISETLVADSAFDGNIPYWYLNAVVEQRDQLITYKGFQYAAYYKQKTGPADRHVAVCRRQLPIGTWESFDFGDYIQSTNDDHNGIAMGICPADGTIHLSFDHHVSPLHYRRSLIGIANNPGGYVWTAYLFGPMGGSAPPDAGTEVTYPKFTTTPDGNLLFEFRDGGSGFGDDILYKYSGASNAWTRMGKFIDGRVNDNNAYPNGFQFDNIGRLHTTWGWRETPDGTTEHDFMYAYSPDTGATWYSSTGLLAGTTGSIFMTSTSSPPLLVWSIPQNSGLWDSEGLGVDRHNRVHTLIAHDTLGTSKLFHYYRDSAGTWRSVYTGITHVYQVQRVVFDADDNAYLPLGGGSIAAASAPNWTDWKIIDSTENGRFLYCALTDGPLARDSCILSVLNQGAAGPNSKNMYVINYKMGGGTSTIINTAGPLRQPRANASIAVTIIGNRFVVPSQIAVAGNMVDIYDIKGTLLYRTSVGTGGMVKNDKSSFRKQIVVVYVR
jgi:hypothetical protein